ncbi:hypothetical protein NEA10_02590 [Phormidium yuhuli AB48]|uniref:Uncharacterized protein n=1 Tax=Phormidium yuhuli AB48 TaxID=2940671 RepID=A0ABY5AQY6_9CYAN|nr:hypothetical protein [Phormidium yuhuli]USR91634.1 hypothetical protein NEA10_02590 [Phormidium yuhuli AB48]
MLAIPITSVIVASPEAIGPGRSRFMGLEPEGDRPCVIPLWVQDAGRLAQLLQNDNLL